MATAVPNITLSAARDIPFNKPSPAGFAQAVDSEAPTLSPGAFVLDGRSCSSRRASSSAASRSWRNSRTELSGFTDGMVDRLEAIGLISEIISWKLRLSEPTGASGPSILAKVVFRVAHKTAG